MQRISLTVVLEDYRRFLDIHDLSECHHLYDLGRHNSQNYLEADLICSGMGATNFTYGGPRGLSQVSRYP